MPTTPTEGGIAWSLEIRSTKQGQKSSTRDQRKSVKSVNMSIGSHSKHSAGHRKRWSFVSRPQFGNSCFSCLAFMNDTNDRTLRPCISWQSLVKSKCSKVRSCFGQTGSMWALPEPFMSSSDSMFTSFGLKSLTTNASLGESERNRRGI